MTIQKRKIVIAAIIAILLLIFIIVYQKGFSNGGNSVSSAFNTSRQQNSSSDIPKMDLTIDLSDIDKMNIGSEMPRLLYADKNTAVMTGTFGLLVYSMKNNTVTNRISFENLKLLGISRLSAAASLDGGYVYFKNSDINSEAGSTYQYEIKSGEIKKISEQPADVFKLSHIFAGYNERYDKYFDLHYLISHTMAETDSSLIYIRAKSDWSMKSLQLVVCQYADGANRIFDVFR